MHLKNLNQSPPGSWTFRHPSGFASSAVTFSSLVAKVAQYRANSQEPNVSEGFNRLADEVEAHICARLTPEDQQALCLTGFTAPRSVHWSQVSRFLLTMLEWIKVGFQTVDTAEAERRAAICVTCPMNVGLRGCAMCRVALAGLRDSVLRGAATSQDAELRACGICGCDNRAQVHVPLSVLRVGRALSYPTYCWKAEA